MNIFVAQDAHQNPSGQEAYILILFSDFRHSNLSLSLSLFFPSYWILHFINQRVKKKSNWGNPTTIKVQQTPNRNQMNPCMTCETCRSKKSPFLYDRAPFSFHSNICYDPSARERYQISTLNYFVKTKSLVTWIEVCERGWDRSTKTENAITVTLKPHAISVKNKIKKLEAA